MSSITTDYISSVISKVIPTLNITEWTYSQKEFKDIGQNYFGVLMPVVIVGTCNGQKRSFHLVLKLAPTEERYRVSGAVTLMFAREVFVYSMLLEQYRLQQAFTHLTVTQYVMPKCYYACQEYCQECIAMQDMCVDGYQPYTQTMFLDYNHIKVSLLALAKLHAHSFILRKRNQSLYDEAKEVCVPLSLKTNARFMEVMENRLNRAIEKFENTVYATKFEYLKQNQVQLIEAAWNSVEDTCICHGDIWKENILFKYENSEPTSACLIDYQTARICSPAYDVLYLIASSTDSDLRQHNLRDLLDIYYEEFESFLEAAGLKCQEEYSRTSFERDLKTLGPACVIVANTALWLASGLQQEGHVRSKRLLNTDEEKLAAVESYKNIMKNLIDDFICFGLLNIVTE